MTVEISSNGCTIKKSERIISTGSRCGILIMIDVQANDECHVDEGEAELWHRRLGHVYQFLINKMIKDGWIQGEFVDAGVVCDVCAIIKQVRETFNSSDVKLAAREKFSRRISRVLRCPGINIASTQVQPPLCRVIHHDE